jgi:hypothetical protein
MDILPRRKLALKRAAMLQTELNKGWLPHYRSIANNLLPRSSRFLGEGRNRGGDRNQDIIDSSGTWALRTLAAGMMSGMTSWLKSTTSRYGSPKSAS